MEKKQELENAVGAIADAEKSVKSVGGSGGDKGDEKSADKVAEADSVNAVKIKNDKSGANGGETTAVKKKDVIISVVLGVLCVFLIIIIALNLFVFVRFTVSGDSMKNTLVDGDVLIYNKVKSPEVGDIVVIDKGEYWIIKRIIAKSGDVVKISGGKLYVNDMETPKTEAYATGELYSDVYSKTFEEKVWTIGDNEYFYLGDNRSVSIDSRENGPISREKILGVVGNYAVSTKGVRNFFAGIFGSNCSGSAK